MMKKLLLTIVGSLGLGVLAIVPVVNSQNGYTAGFVILPLLLLIALICLILIIIAVVFLAKDDKDGLYFLLAIILLVSGFVGSGMIANKLELGAYREDPIVSFTPEISNIVIFNKNVTNEQINEFLDTTISTKEDKGSRSLPGLKGMIRWPQIEGHEATEFSFFSSATDEQREYVYSRIRSSPIVFKLLENVPTKDYMPTPESPSSDNRPTKEFKSVNATAD